MKAALFAVAADLSAIRKISQFLGHKADFGCSRCKFKAEREPHTIGASGKMSYFTLKKGLMQKLFHKLENLKKQHQKQKEHVLLKKMGLGTHSWFDCHTSVDPMHTFLLGMVKRETILSLAMMTDDEKREFTRILKSMKLPYDIGRLPSNMFERDSLDGATADQWKVYITVCARPCMYKLIPKRAYQSLVLLSKIVISVTALVLSCDDIVNGQLL